MIQWILSLMLLLQPTAPWKDTYEQTATSISQASKKYPIFQGPKGTEETATLLISVAWFESRFNPKAVGDHGKSFGLYQQQLHVGLDKEALFDTDVATKVAIDQFKVSFRVCRNRPIEEKLGWYAAGKDDCERGLQESRHRMLKARWLFKNHPYKGE